MSKCFVIQPFDRGKFDKRYDDVLAPAIKAASLEPYRVDRDPAVSIPIDEIQSGIESSYACLADITTDNPNVWFELGYAIASRREVVLICSEERQSKFPFDVQHRTIIKYSADSPSDFETLKLKITDKLSALIKKDGSLRAVASMSIIASVQGLEQHELATLITVAAQINNGISADAIQTDMNNSGMTPIAAAMGIRGLVRKGMIEEFVANDDWNNDYVAYRVTEEGVSWLTENSDKLKFYSEPKSLGRGVFDPDIPF